MNKKFPFEDEGFVHLPGAPGDGHTLCNSNIQLIGAPESTMEVANCPKCIQNLKFYKGLELDPANKQVYGKKKFMAQGWFSDDEIEFALELYKEKKFNAVKYLMDISKERRSNPPGLRWHIEFLKKNS